MHHRLPPAAILSKTDHRPWPLPSGPWIQRQSWLEFLFLHWTVDPAVLRPLIPPELDLDLWAGQAWVGIIPFRMTGVTLRGLPDLPGFSAFHELNVRTYVRHGDTTAVYFLSLEANQALAVRAARAWYGLPYFDARMSSTVDGDRFTYRSERTHRGASAARFTGRWTVGAPLGPAAPGTQEHWLCERYALLTAQSGQVRRGDVHHVPWPLHAVDVQVEENTMGSSHGLPISGPPVHALYSPGVDTVLWPLSLVR